MTILYATASAKISTREPLMIIVMGRLQGGRLPKKEVGSPPGILRHNSNGNKTSRS
jgi:hypothetical protein